MPEPRSKIRVYFNKHDIAKAKTRKLRKARHTWFEVMYYRLNEGEECQFKGSGFKYTKTDNGFVETKIYELIQAVKNSQ